MTEAHACTLSGSTLFVEERLADAEVESLCRLLSSMSRDSTVTVELSRARSVAPHALVRLQQEVVRHARFGHRVLLRGLTMAQARLLELAR